MFLMFSCDLNGVVHHNEFKYIKILMMKELLM